MRLDYWYFSSCFVTNTPTKVQNASVLDYMAICSKFCLLPIIPTKMQPEEYPCLSATKSFVHINYNALQAPITYNVLLHFLWPASLAGATHYYLTLTRRIKY